jgi:hypothetical protein
MMRLPMLDRGHFSWSARLKMAFMHLMSRHRAPDVVKLHFFRHETVGARMSTNFQAAMRGKSEWSLFDREIMAAFISALNQCVF